MLPPEWMMISSDWTWPNDAFWCICMSVLCIFCGYTVTAPYKCCWQDDWYFLSSIRIGMSLMEWIILVIIGILIDNDVIQDKSSYLFKTQHCLYFFIVCLIFYVIFTWYCYLMPDLRLPYNIPIRSMCGYAFLGEITELERLSNNINNNSSLWDTPIDDFEFLEQPFSSSIANAFCRLGYHSGVLLSIELNDQEIDLLYDKIKHFNPEMGKIWSRSDIEDKLKDYQKEGKSNNKLASIFALSNKQYETLKWLESNGAKQHICLFKTNNKLDGVCYKKMGFEWARMILRQSDADCQNYKF